ncbi:unnamed protein product [Heligmosomoides polygyrus]|uniref:G_PROTEIN_RECEP_F1_2 domain-containing protein n=1 Tax=Heligmosomoides polygyrus TaxID=6339 RepID=A0A183GH87_HELPZ|nr:unnamed protein product [Heligmosomoides polygyrus]
MSEEDQTVFHVIFAIVACVLQVAVATAGIFGHVIILFVTYRTKEIQNKYGLLLVQLSITHIICIFGELMNTAFIVAAPVLPKTECFKIFAALLVVMIWQSLIMLSISIDLLCAIVFPIHYRKWTARASVCVNVVVCGFISVAYTMTIYGHTDTTGSGICNVYTAQNHSVFTHTEALAYTIAVLQNACYRNQHRKTMRTISMLIVIYMCTWVLSILTTDAIHFVADVEWRFIMWMVASVLQMLCFAQTFYVCYQRSSEYRNIFRRLFKLLKLPKDVKIHLQQVCSPEKTHIRSISFVMT